LKIHVQMGKPAHVKQKGAKKNKRGGYKIRHTQLTNWAVRPISSEPKTAQTAPKNREPEKVFGQQGVKNKKNPKNPSVAQGGERRKGNIT